MPSDADKIREWLKASDAGYVLHCEKKCKAMLEKAVEALEEIGTQLPKELECNELSVATGLAIRIGNARASLKQMAEGL